MGLNSLDEWTIMIFLRLGFCTIETYPGHLYLYYYTSHSRAQLL